MRTNIDTFNFRTFEMIILFAKSNRIKHELRRIYVCVCVLCTCAYSWLNRFHTRQKTHTHHTPIHPPLHHFIQHDRTAMINLIYEFVTPVERCNRVKCLTLFHSHFTSCVAYARWEHSSKPPSSATPQPESKQKRVENFKLKINFAPFNHFMILHWNLKIGCNICARILIQFPITIWFESTLCQ